MFKTNPGELMTNKYYIYGICSSNLGWIQKQVIIIIIIRQPLCPVVGRRPQYAVSKCPNDPVLCCPLPYRVAPVFVQVISPPLGWSLLSSFLVIWSPSGDTRRPSVVFEAVDVPCPGPFRFYQNNSMLFYFDLTIPLDDTLFCTWQSSENKLFCPPYCY